MKVAMLAPDESYEKGISIYSKDLVESIKRQKIQIDLVTYKNRKFSSFLKIIPKLRDYNIIHIQHENRLFGVVDGVWFMPFITLLKIFSRGKIIITMHTVHTKNEPLFSSYPFLNFLKRRITYPLNYIFTNLFAEKIIVHAPFLKESLVENSSVKKSKIVIIPHGAKLDTPYFNKSESKKELNLKGKVYLMIGTMGLNKGFDLILKQAKNIGKTIMIVGGFGGSKKGYIEELQEYVKQEGLQKIVKFDLKEDINSRSPTWWKYFSAANLILLPYRVTTTSGIFVDAMGSEKPVVSSNLDYFSEIARDYGCIKIAKKVEDYPKVIKEALKQHKFMESEARRFKKLNDISLVGKKHKELYEKILK